MTESAVTRHLVVPIHNVMSRHEIHHGIREHLLLDDCRRRLVSGCKSKQKILQKRVPTQVNDALPNQETVTNELAANQLKINENLYICGDHLMNGSINAAMKSGRLVAELIDNENKM